MDKSITLHVGLDVHKEPNQHEQAHMNAPALKATLLSGASS